MKQKATISRVQCKYDEYREHQVKAELSREKLNECIKEMIRITIEDIDKRESPSDSEKPSFFKKCHNVVTGLYYLTPLAKLTHPVKHKLAWQVLTEFQQYHREQACQHATDTA